MAKNIQIGDVWLAKSKEMPGTYWPFQVLSAIESEGELFYAAIKTTTQPCQSSLVLFDSNGIEVEDFTVMSFELYRKSKRKPIY